MIICYFIRSSCYGGFSLERTILTIFFINATFNECSNLALEVCYFENIAKEFMNYRNILYEFFCDEKIFLSKRKLLIVFLGSFADFDSFEYSQQLSSKTKFLENHLVDLVVIGIGSEKSKNLFCNFNKIDHKSVFAVNNSDLHNKLQLNNGLSLPVPSIINLLLMCAGISSRGTIKEVVRGYLGDRKARRIFRSDEIIKIGSLLSFKGKMFELFTKDDILRPFELATRRLMNMIEILSNWNVYVSDASSLTQRGATILLNEKDEIIYKFFAESLLVYSRNMTNPLSFLDVITN